MRAVDTNVLVRLLTGDDPAQTAVAEEFVRKGAWVSHVVLAEAVWVLGSFFRRTAKQIASSVESLLLHGEVSVQDTDVVIAALAQFRANSGIAFSDCLILEIARKAGHLPLGSFDRQLAKLDGAQLIS